MRHNKGFTFVELLVVITIIAILMAAAIVSYASVNRGSRDAKRKADLEGIRSALEICRVRDGVYPTSITTNISCTDGTVALSTTPTDPKSGNAYTYNTGASPIITYSLCANEMEDEGVYCLANP